MRKRFIIGAIVVITLLCTYLWTFNQGVDYGLDVGICVSTVQYTQIHPADISFCERADPTTAVIQDKAREIYLRANNNHI